MNTSRCEDPQVCLRLGFHIHGKQYTLYVEDPWFREVVNRRAVKNPSTTSTEVTGPVDTEGPGKELSVLLSYLGFSGICSECSERAKRMNRWGVTGCRKPENHQQIIDWLTKEKDSAGLIEKLRAVVIASQEPWFSFSDPIGSLVDEAIRRAEAKEQSLPNHSQHLPTSVITQTEKAQ